MLILMEVLLDEWIKDLTMMLQFFKFQWHNSRTYIFY